MNLAARPRSRFDETAVSNRRRLDGLELDALVGVYDRERAVPQRVRISLDLDLRRPDIDGVDGEALVRAVVGAGHITLIETLAERIAERCLEDTRIRSVIVRVEKLEIFPDAVVGIEIERPRS